MAGANTEPRPNEDQILSGLKAVRAKHNIVGIHPDTGDIKGKPFDLSVPIEEDALMAWVRKMQGAGYNIYFHANPVKDGFTGVKATKADMAACTHAQLDLDPDANPNESYQIRRDAVEFAARTIMRDHSPSVVIDSGNGFNILWKLDTPLSVEDYEGPNKAMNAHFGAKGTFESCRILKVPGTVAHSGKTKLAKGYPGKRQAKLVKAENVETNFDILPKAATGATGATGTTTTTKETVIPLPDRVGQKEKLRLRDVINNDKELKQALTPDRYLHNQSDGLEAVAGACSRNPELDRLDYATIVWLADKSCAHQHLMRQQDKERALGRAWDDVQGLPGKEEFGQIDGANAVPPPKPKINPEDFDEDDLALDGQDDLLSYTPDQFKHFVDDFNMEGVRFLIGQPKMGKSWLLLQEAQAIAEGQPDFLGMRVHRGRVLYCGFEDGKNRLHHRLKLLNTQPCRDIKYWYDALATKEENFAKMVAIYQRFPFDVMYVDTLKDWLGFSQARHGTAYDQSVEDIMPLVNFAKEKNVSLTFTTHMKKDKKGVSDWMDLIQGSIGSGARATLTVMLDRQRNADDAILHRTGRDITNEDDIAVHFNGMPTAWDLSPYSAASIAAKTKARGGSAKQQIIDLLRSFGPQVDKKELHGKVGGSKSAFNQALKDLKDDLVADNDGNNVWLI